MGFSIYDASVPVLLRGLGQLSHLLEKGVAHAESVKADPAVLFNARLALDMFPLSRQVQIASDTAKGAGGRLAGIEVPSFPDTESNFAELQERISKTVTFLRGIDPGKFEGAEEREIVLKFPQGEVRFTGATYLLHFVLPNLFFHTVTTYDILRHNGVPVGKMDFLGKAD